MVIGLLLIPLISYMGIIGNMDSIEIDTNQVQQSIVQNMSAEEKAKLQHVENVMNEISKECSKRKLKSIVSKKAQAVYACAFYDVEKSDNDFISKLVDCFEQAKDDNELLNMLNSTFGTNISAEDFNHLISTFMTGQIKTMNAGPLPTPYTFFLITCVSCTYIVM